MDKIQVIWMDPGPSCGRVDTVSRKFILQEGILFDGQNVKVQLSKKKGSKAKVWNAKVVMMIDDDRAREPSSKRRKKEAAVPAHI